MDAKRIDHALDRIESAFSRIEAVLDRLSVDPNGPGKEGATLSAARLGEENLRLREAMAEALVEIDQLIGRMPS